MKPTSFDSTSLTLNYINRPMGGSTSGFNLNNNINESISRFGPSSNVSLSLQNDTQRQIEHLERNNNNLEQMVSQQEREIGELISGGMNGLIGGTVTCLPRLSGGPIPYGQCLITRTIGGMVGHEIGKQLNEKH